MLGYSTIVDKKGEVEIMWIIIFQDSIILLNFNREKYFLVEDRVF